MDATAPPPAALEGPQLRILRCTWCTMALYRPHLLCPTCGGGRLRPQISAGTGRTHSWLRIGTSGHTARQAALVELDEGFRVQGRLRDSLPGLVPVGARVRLYEGDDGADRAPVFVVNHDHRTASGHVAAFLRQVNAAARADVRS